MHKSDKSKHGFVSEPKWTHEVREAMMLLYKEQAKETFLVMSAERLIPLEGTGALRRESPGMTFLKNLTNPFFQEELFGVAN